MSRHSKYQPMENMNNLMDEVKELRGKIEWLEEELTRKMGDLETDLGELTEVNEDVVELKEAFVELENRHDDLEWNVEDMERKSTDDTTLFESIVKEIETVKSDVSTAQQTFGSLLEIIARSYLVLSQKRTSDWLEGVCFKRLDEVVKYICLKTKFSYDIAIN